MALSLSNRDQSSGHLFYNRRLRAATTRFSVRMKHDDRKQTGAMMVSVFFVLLGIAWCVMSGYLKPQGVAGNSAIIGDRDNGALYARIDGKLRPAQNLVSAELAIGHASAVTWVKPAEIDKYPHGPMVGIPGAPVAMVVNTGAPSAWAVCDTAGSARSGDKTVVTAIAGPLSRAGRAAPMTGDTAVLATFGGGTYAIWGGKRSQVDPADRAVTSSLGIDPAVTVPVTMSRALFDAMPSTEPLRVPEVPQAGQDSKWLPGSPIGTVLQAQTTSGGTQFYVLLADGVQKINSFVADLLRSANSYGAAAPRQVSPDVLVKTPLVTTLPVDYYPTGRLKFVDTVANPTTCVGWEKAPSDPQARVTVYNGRGLPVSAGLDDRVVNLVRDDRDPASVEADKVLMLPGATNFVASTSAVLDARSHESLFWVSTEGVRYGIAGDDKSVEALGLSVQRAQQAPWPLLRVWAAGPELSRTAALRERDTVPTGGIVRVLDDSAPGAQGAPAAGPPPPPVGSDSPAGGDAPAPAPAPAAGS
ncbi:type VII secretion protein EccB [Mycolicibacterium llatzerense]|uniref:type VII secretion protein EccB n=1 Tax=Mycolicibacterium llatzerense TaxID=280871 RepID=UPI0028CB5F2A|nr:type VII secretion protein EccB [Mycolicibacterium llatzerense]